MYVYKKYPHFLGLHYIPVFGYTKNYLTNPLLIRYLYCFQFFAITNNVQCKLAITYM